MTTQRRKSKSVVEPDDLKIIQAIKSGQSNYFQSIVDRYEPYLFVTVNKIVKDEEEAKDILQDIFIKVFNNLGKYQPDFTFNAWITRLTMNHMVDVIRRNKSMKQHNFISLDAPKNIRAYDEDAQKIDVADEESLPFDEENYEEIHEKKFAQVSDAMNELSVMEKEIVNLFYIKQMRQIEIAKKLDLTLENLRVKLLRIKVKLRKVVTGEKLKLEKVC